MTQFDKSQWAEGDFAREYRDHAEVYVIERRRLLTIIRSFHKHFLKTGQKKKILDLGCGDGIITHEILKIDDTVSATLLDGSKDMLSNAKERLKEFKNIQYECASFQDILKNEILKQGFDLVVSSLAIHHLTMDEKKSLFRNIHSYLNSGGYFVNIDVVLSPADTLEQWYMSLWREWIDEKKHVLGVNDNSCDDIIKRYKDNTDNNPDTLYDQLEALQYLGFKDVDCFYKYGIFVMYGGRK